MVYETLGSARRRGGYDEAAVQWALPRVERGAGVTFQGAGEQLRIFELEPTTPEPKRKRVRGKGKPRAPRWKQPPLANARLKVVNNDGDRDPCNSGPGICVVLHCRKNLIGWFTEAGNYHVPAVHDIPGMTLPVDTVRFGGASPQGSRPVTADDLDECTIMVLRRILFLMAFVGTLREDGQGSTCRKDLPRGLSQRVVGLVLGVSKQRVDQDEQMAMRKLKRNAMMKRLNEESGDDVKPWASNHARSPARRGD